VLNSKILKKQKNGMPACTGMTILIECPLPEITVTPAQAGVPFGFLIDGVIRA
jgi:hypothetical protein